MKKIMILSMLTALTFGAFAQETETRQFDNFSAIEVGTAIELIITQGNTNEAIVEVNDIDLEDVITEVRGSELNIKRRSRNNTNNTNNRGEVVVRLTYKSIDELSVNSAASIYSKSVIKATDFELNASSAGNAELELDVTDLRVKVSSAGSLELSGTCASMDLDASSAGKLDGYDLVCGAIKADVSSGGSGRVSVKDKLEVDAGTGGSLYYKGDPDKVLADTNLGGRVQKR
ncbi:MAG: head GIN domain-containing protein [Reichenbachiella sp.]|uniref:head GIN domain-containing protein n=1 Tax=Reichenbachiella sp. TaxID=2184521 RepID=UPI0032663A2B